MADQVITKQELIDAQKDAQTLEDVINGEPGKLIKTRLGRLVYTLASVPQINTMTREEVTSALAPKADKTETAAALDTKANQADTFLKSEVTGLVAPKADKTYVDSAIGAISTDASKQYATLALANADIANIALNKNIFVSEAANGGYWHKATAGATSLTKSPYDPVTQAKADATTKANAAEVSAKGYADTNKLDISKILFEYVNGNKIGAKTPKYINLGISSGLAISANAFYDSVVLRVKEGDLLFLLNDKQQYGASNGGAFAFFAEDPSVNRTQARITDNRASATDTATSLVHQKVTVPTGAKYLMLNTRYTNAAGTVNSSFTWAVHADSFKSTYTQGTEIISEVLNTPVGKTDDFKKAKEYTDQQIANVEKIKVSTKNLFNPTTIITGGSYNNDGTLFYSAGRRRTIKYPINTGEWLSISGMDSMAGSAANTLQFWDGLDGSTFLQKIDLPTAPTTTSFSVQAPVNATHFSFNINTTIIPTYLQVEKSPAPTTYEPYYLLEHGTTNGQVLGSLTDKSIKNLYDGGVLPRYRLLNNGVQNTPSENDTITSFIPVEYGKYYTISGLDLSLRSSGQTVLGYSSNFRLDANFVKNIPVNWSSETTIYIDDPAIRFILFPLTSNLYGTFNDAKRLPIQVEEGRVATAYEPRDYTPSALKLYSAGLMRSKSLVSASISKVVKDFTQLDKVRDSVLSTLATPSKNISPLGFSFSVEGASAIECASNNFYSSTQVVKSGTKTIYANVLKLLGSNQVVGVLKPTAFTVPSGQFDNTDLPMLSSYNQRNAKFDYCHPNISYDATGVAGFKYWMLSSILPAGNLGDVQWEDEDLFVSNDAKNWQRVRSLYESDKSYTTTALRLPAHSLVTNSTRKYGFLPCPAVGDTLEISVPSDNGAPALERVNITLTALPWKHDPAILIDGGYVYTYHSFHLPYVEREGGKNRFIVCVRTNDGINWEVVRTDGSTMLLTEETSRQIFTKDAQGRYNYMYYAYSRGYSNPEVIKWGEGDYEMYYGANFTMRLKGTTPYNFDFANPHPFKDVGSGNHPALFKNGADLILVNNAAVFKSTDRGVNFTEYDHYPLWVGGISGYGYKKAAVIGEGGKLIVVDVQMQVMPSYQLPTAANGVSNTNNVHQIYIYEYPSSTDFLNKATNGLIDAYIDVQLCAVNYAEQGRRYFFMPAVSLQSTSLNVHNPLQHVKVCDLELREGDTLHAYVTLNSRHGAKIVFGGIDIA